MYHYPLEDENGNVNDTPITEIEKDELKGLRKHFRKLGNWRKAELFGLELERREMYENADEPKKEMLSEVENLIRIIVCQNELENEIMEDAEFRGGDDDYTGMDDDGYGYYEDDEDEEEGWDNEWEDY